MKAIFFFLGFFCINVLSVYSQDIVGKWYGQADLGVMKLRIEFDIQSSGEGYTATMLSPDQSSQEIPATSVTWEEDTLTINVAPIAFTYIGKLSADKLEGSFSQMGNRFKLDLSRDKPAINRPQNPQPPFPYKEEKIVFQNKEVGIELAGTLTLPESGKNAPAVVLVTGSGPQNRDEEIMGHKPFLVLADYLTRRGIAVLRYDDRGFGESGGVYATASIVDFASDARAAIEYLKSREEIDKGKVGILGHSEGGCVAFILAAQQIPSFIIAMAGPGIPGRELMNLQRAALLKANGATDDFISEYNRVLDKASELAITISDKEELKEKLMQLLAGTPLAGSGNQLIEQLSTPGMVSLLQFNPEGFYPRIQCPVLALNGGKDVQVIADENIEAIANGLEKAGNKKVETKIYPELNHLFQTATTGLPVEYGQIEETISPQVLKDIADWIK